MIIDGENCYYLALKSLSRARLLHGITSKHNDDHYCLSCPNSFRAESKLKVGLSSFKKFVFFTSIKAF